MLGHLALSDIIQTAPERETPDRIDIPARLSFPEPPLCPECNRPMTKNGMEMVRVVDAPSRGKRVLLLLEKERRRCRRCKQQQTSTSRALRSGYHVLTQRLVRHIWNRLIKTTIADVSRETGLTEDVVSSLAHELDERLQRQPSHWTTPQAVAIDNIQTAPGHRFQVLLDQIAGRPIAIAKSWSFEPIRDQVLRHLDVGVVRVFSSDMSDVNRLLSELFTNAVHVADRFHVAQACNEAAARVIRTRIDALNEAGDHAAAAALKMERPALLGEILVKAIDNQAQLDLGKVPAEWRRYPDIAAAYDVRMQLARFYASTGMPEAFGELNELYRQMDDQVIVRAMKPARRYIRDHQREVLGYFEALDLMGHDLWSPTTSSLERRNGTLQAIWRSGRAYRDIRLFRLRAIYHPYTFGIDLHECPQCPGFAGPLDAKQALAISQSETSQLIECRNCAPATPHSVESNTSSPEYGVAA